MKILFLSGYGIDLSVDSGRLIIRDGRDLNKEPTQTVLKPKGDEYDGIVIYGHSGNISLDAMRWLSKQNIPLTILNWDGRVLTNVLIPEMKQGVIRMAQYDAYRDGRRLAIAKAIIEAKISSSIKVLDWIVTRYPEVKDTCQAHFDELGEYRPFLATARTPKEVMGIEGMVARNYWLIVQEIVDDKFGFEGRVTGKAGKPMGAVDPVNVLFNYGYAMLETQCWIAINGNGLDPYVGFLHEAAPYKAPLIYDLQEPFRWLVDVAVLRALENKEFKKSDFVLTENYNLRLKPQSTRRLIEKVNAEFISKVEYKGKSWEWSGIIQQKAGELSDFLKRKKRTLDFAQGFAQLIVVCRRGRGSSRTGLNRGNHGSQISESRTSTLSELRSEIPFGPPFPTDRTVLTDGGDTVMIIINDDQPPKNDLIKYDISY